MEPTNTPNIASVEKVQCAECGNGFPRGEVLVFGNVNICLGCKPVFQQKLSEGSFSPEKLRYASVGRRFVAVLADGIITWVVMLLLTFASLAISGGDKGVMAAMSSMVATVLSTVLGVTYYVYLNGKYGATFGKMMMGIKIVRAGGKSIGFGLAFGRYFAQFINVFTFGFGYLMAIWDKEKRGLHDRVCGTRVVHS